MTITYESMVTLIENTTMQKILRDGTHWGYTIEPNDSYVLHDNSYDYYAEYDEEGNPIGEPILGYRTSQASCTIAQFEANTREFYAVLATSVPENQIFGNVTPETEVM